MNKDKTHKDVLSQNSPEWIKRQYNHRHNGHMGTIGCIETYLKLLEASPSVTTIGKLYIEQIRNKLYSLKDEVYTYRVEPDGHTHMMEHKGERDIERLRTGG